MIETVLFLAQNFVQLALAVFLITAIATMAGRGLLLLTNSEDTDLARTAGLGFAGIGLSLAMSYALTKDVFFGLVLVWLYLICGLIHALSKQRSKEMFKRVKNKQLVRTRLTAAFHPEKLETWISRVVLLVAFFPFFKWGPTYATRLVNDLPNYAASVRIWRYGIEKFEYLHPDNFGALQLSRASFEKPFVTGLMSGFEILTRVDSLQMFSPIFVIAVLVSVKSLTSVIQSRVKDITFASLLAVLPFVGFWHAIRVVDSQPGHILSVMFLCLSLEQLASSVDRGVFDTPSLINLVIFCSVSLLSNPTLFLAASPLVLVLMLAIMGNPLGWSSNLRWEINRRVLIAVFPITGLFLMAPMVLKSVRQQTSENFGFPSDFPSPLVFFGFDKLINAEVFALSGVKLWVIALVALTAVLLLAERMRRFVGLGFVLASLAITLAIGFRLGFSDYSSGKWISILTILVIPFSMIVTERSERFRRAFSSHLLAVLVGVLATANSLATYVEFDGRLNVIPKQAYGFDMGSSVAADDVINVELSNLYRASAYSLIQQTNPSVITEQTYARASVPIGDIFLIEPDTYDAEFEEIISHPDGAVLVVQRDSDLGGSRNLITGSRALHKLVAYPKGSWGTSENGIVLPEGRHGGLRISLTLPQEGVGGESEILLNLSSASSIEIRSFVFNKPANLTQLDSDTGLLLSVTDYEINGGGVLEIWLELSQPGGGDLEITAVEFQRRL